MNSNLCMPEALFYLDCLESFISNRRASDYFNILLSPCVIVFPVFNANIIYPNQRHVPWRLIWICTVCQWPFSWDARLKWANSEVWSLQSRILSITAICLFTSTSVAFFPVRSVFVGVLFYEVISFGLCFDPASILRKSISGRHRPVSYPDGPMTARYRFT